MAKISKEIKEEIGKILSDPKRRKNANRIKNTMHQLPVKVREFRKKLQSRDIDDPDHRTT